MLAIAILIVASSLVLALATFSVLGRLRPIGDEADYLASAEMDDPHAPRPFLRMPLMIWLARLFSENEVRGLLAMSSVLTVALTASAGWILGGPAVAVWAAFLLLIQPERILMACHIWPDSLLALMIAALAFLMVLPEVPGSLLLLAAGVISAIGCLARIDFVVMPALVWLSLTASGEAIGGAGAALLFGPALLAGAGWTAHNFRRYGIPLPDNTWTLNLMVTEAETELRAEAEFAFDHVVCDTLDHWHEIPMPERGDRAFRSLGAALGRPGRFLRGVGRRFLTLCGPDTFLRDKTLPADGACPELDDRLRRFLDLPLRIAFPLLVTLFAVLTAWRRDLPDPWAWPAFGLMAVAVLFFVRTRHRVALLPILSLLVAEGLAALGTGLRPFTSADVVLFSSAPFLFVALVRIRSSRELPRRRPTA